MLDAVNKANVKHIIFMLQENRSFDSHFGQLNAFRAAMGLSQDVDGLPAGVTQFADNGTPVSSYHFQTACIENITPDWLESHGDYNLATPASEKPTLDGFIHNGSTFKRLDVPGADSTFVDGMFGGTIVGSYQGNSGPSHGFIYDGSTFTTLDVPGANGTIAGHARDPAQKAARFSTGTWASIQAFTGASAGWARHDAPLHVRRPASRPARSASMPA